jgi:hypothetical protein
MPNVHGNIKTFIEVNVEYEDWKNSVQDEFYGTHTLGYMYDQFPKLDFEFPSDMAEDDKYSNWADHAKSN